MFDSNIMRLTGGSSSDYPQRRRTRRRIWGRRQGGGQREPRKEEFSTDEMPAPLKLIRAMEQKKLMVLKEIFVASMQHVADCFKVFSVSVKMTFKKSEWNQSSFDMDKVEAALKEVIARDKSLSEYEVLINANGEPHDAIEEEIENEREARRDVVCAALEQEAMRYNDKIEATRSATEFDERKVKYPALFLKMWSSYTLNTL